MKLPFVKKSTAAALQGKLDAERARSRKKDHQVKTAQGKTKQARQKVQDLHRELDQTRAELQETRWALAEAKSRAVVTPEELARLLSTMDGRYMLSLRFLKGQGLEIGALSNPTPTRPGTLTRYYDYLTAEQNRERFPQLLANAKLVEPDYLGDGEKLELIADGSLDYLIANHMLEHCQDVIGTLKTFWSKLRQGGALLLALPDKRYTFDHPRPNTPFEHLVQDYEGGPHTSLHQHYQEFHQLVTEDAVAAAQTKEEVHALPHVDIHFHVWTQADILEMFLRLGKEHGFNWEIEGVLRQGNEFISVLRKEDVQLWDRAKPETEPGKEKTA